MDLEEAPISERSGLSLRVMSQKVRRAIVTTFPGVVHAWSSGTTANGVPARYGILARLLVELCGTFILVLSATIETQAPGTRAAYLASQGQPFAVAATVVIIVTVGAPVSGAHYNPAISLAFWLGGEETHANRPLLYVCTQILAGTAAATVSYVLDGYDMGLPVLHPADPAVSAWAKVCFAEVLATYFFCSFVLYVAMVAHPPLGNFGPVAVGLGVFAIIMSFRFASGAGARRPAPEPDLTRRDGIAGASPPGESTVPLDRRSLQPGHRHGALDRRGGHREARAAVGRNRLLHPFRPARRRAGGNRDSMPPAAA